MDEHDLHNMVLALLEELNNPQRHLSTISNDFSECGIDYCVIGSLAVCVHNYLREGHDIDVLVSRKTFPKIEKCLMGNGYSCRPGSERHLYYEYLGGRTPLDVYVEGEERDGFPLPDPGGSRIQVCRVWYADLPLLMTLKIRAKDMRDVVQLIQENELGEEFADSLEPDVRETFLDMLRKSEESSP